jgi:hypothetical protein
MALAYKRPIDPKTRGPEQMVWAVRLLVEAGGLKPAEVPDLPPCPDDASGAVRRVYDGFKLLLQCKGRVSEWAGQPTAFSKDFAAAWCGVCPLTAHRARLLLAQRGVIHICGKHQGRTCVYKPGPHPKHPDAPRRHHDAEAARRRAASLARIRRIAAKLGEDFDPWKADTREANRLMARIRSDPRMNGVDRFLFHVWHRERAWAEERRERKRCERERERERRDTSAPPL